MVAATPNPNLIAFVGDLHGKLAAFEHTAAQALNRGCTTIIQVGDFWIYDGPKELPKLQRVLRRICPDGIKLSDIDYRFIDGNHENFDVINPDAAGPVQMSDNVTYMPRGSRARLAGVELLFLGGASSIDKHWRTEGLNWWPAENITEAQADRAITAATDPDQPPVDILVTHETTTEAFTALARGSEHAQDKAGEPAGETNRAHHTRVRDAAAPRVHVHGHHHTRFAAPVAGVLDVGLNKETRDGSVAILDTTDWTWTIPVERFTYTYPNDDLTQPPTEHRHVEHQGLFEWDTINLPAAEMSLDDYAGQADPGTVESITAHRMTLQRKVGPDGPRFLRQRWVRYEIDKVVEQHPEREQPAEQFTQWITDEDFDALATHLLDPRPEFNVYRELSPLVKLWSTEEIRLWATDAARRTGQ